MQKLSREFYTRDTITVSKEMLGKFIVRKDGRQKIIGKIVETEAYIGPQDRASHAYGGKKTARNIAEYYIGGHIYIYLVYGMYWQLNISTAVEGVPECVLIRALEPVVNGESEFTDREFKNLANGPGKLCRYLKVDKIFYGEDVVTSDKIWLEDRGEKIDEKYIVATGRVGIDYAGKYWAKRKWRFYIKNNHFVSKL